MNYFCFDAVSERRDSHSLQAHSYRGVKDGKSVKEFTTSMQCNVSIGSSVRSIDSKQKIHIEFCLAGFYVKYFSSRRCCYCLYCWVLVFQLLSHFKSNPTHEIGKSAIYCTWIHTFVCLCVRHFVCLLRFVFYISAFLSHLIARRFTSLEPSVPFVYL